jgi:hypothetical protein
LTQSDPTDHALAAIASIYDQPESHGEMEKPAEGAPSIAPAQADGYSKSGPGPIAALRIKWTVRHAEHDDYYVDETIGEHSTPAASGPMSLKDAVKLVDDRQSKACERFEQLKSEMAGRDATNLARNDLDES